MRVRLTIEYDSDGLVEAEQELQDLLALAEDIRLELRLSIVEAQVEEA